MSRPTNGTSKPRPGSVVRCAIYTRKSTEEGLEKEFNSLDAQRDSAEAYITSQKAEGWIAIPERYDDGGFTGGNMDRPAVTRLMADIEAGKVDCVVVYKVDRLSRSLLDFARMMETFEKFHISFVSVTQQFNTSQSMGRLMLNVLLSFAQFEREIISERTRDKIAAARRKGKWSGGMPILGYDVDPRGSKLVVNPAEAEQVRAIFELYLDRQSLIRTAAELNQRGWTTKRWVTHAGRTRGGRPFDKGNLHKLFSNVTYLGRIRYKDEVHPGEHEGIVDEQIWQRAQQMLHLNGRSGGMHTRNKHGALLKGLLHCACCNVGMGHTYTVKKGNRCYRYYVCYTAQKRGWKACPSRAVPAEQIEQFVVDQVRGMGRDPGLRSATLERARARAAEHLATLESQQLVVDRELGQLHRRLRQAAESAGTDRSTSAVLAELNERLAAAENRKAELQSALDEARGQQVGHDEMDAALTAFDPVWQSLSPSEKARALRLLVHRVDFDGPKGKVSISFRESGVETLGPVQAAPTAEACV